MTTITQIPTPDPILHDVMIDIETLSTGSNAAVLSIGAVKFNPNTGVMGETFHQRVNFTEAVTGQIGQVDIDTVKWWITQDAAAGKDVVSGEASLAEVLNNFSQFLGLQAIPWGNGATFDITILDNAYKHCGMPVPWEYWNVRDCRTIVAVAEGLCDRDEFTRLGVHHNALDDSIFQATYISGMWQKLREAERGQKFVDTAPRIDLSVTKRDQ